MHLDVLDDRASAGALEGDAVELVLVGEAVARELHPHIAEDAGVAPLHLDGRRPPQIDQQPPHFGGALAELEAAVRVVVLFLPSGCGRPVEPVLPILDQPAQDPHQRAQVQRLARFSPAPA